MAEPTKPLFAASTTVSTDQTLREIKDVIRKYGGRNVHVGESDHRLVFAFEHGDADDSRLVRFEQYLPTVEDYALDSRRRALAPKQAQQAYEKAMRQRYRILLAVIRFRFEQFLAGIYTFDETFALEIVMPDGRTVAQHVVPQVAEAYTSGHTPKLLPPWGGER
jgi:hypothetical protein